MKYQYQIVDIEKDTALDNAVQILNKYGEDGFAINNIYEYMRKFTNGGQTVYMRIIMQKIT